jgi:hypothetical protein
MLCLSSTGMINRYKIILQIRTMVVSHIMIAAVYKNILID